MHLYASDITHHTGLNALCVLPQIDRVLEEAKQFFSLPQDLKSKYRRTANSNNNGYVALLEEKYVPYCKRGEKDISPPPTLKVVLLP